MNAPTVQPPGPRPPRLNRRPLAAFLVLVALAWVRIDAQTPSPEDPGFGPPISVSRDAKPSPDLTRKASNWIDQTPGEARLKSAGCLECHGGIEAMHASPNVVLGCVDCHGGNPTPGLTQRKAHVPPRNPEFWESSANPNDSSVLLNHESPEFIRFVNPGDLRVAEQTCGPCHSEAVRNVPLSMMNHGAMLWGAALYNNGSVPHKDYRYGQAYGPLGTPLRLVNPEPVTAEATRAHGVLPFLDPLPRFASSQPGNILRVAEKGGERPAPVGLPVLSEAPGRPPSRLSDRGLGTLARIDPVFMNLQKTRLHDPLLGFLGSNNHPGDYRSSGCSACHVVYANDRSPTHSGGYSQYGHQGLSFSGDPMISKRERGHPIHHRFTRSIPSSQCIVCHMHQGNLFVNPFLGYTWWDQESDGERMYLAEQRTPSDAEQTALLRNNPEGASVRGRWSDLDFLDKVAELNPELRHNQFADYHGHGWVFRAVFKQDRRGRLLDLEDQVIPYDRPDTFTRAVHLKDVHLARGMQCVDCHFTQDVHGNGRLYGEPRAATTIECIDCHGTILKRPTLVTSGNGGRVDLGESVTPWGPRFEWEGDRLFQASMMTPGTRWEVPQTRDTIDPASRHYNPKSRYAKTLRRDGVTWGDVPEASTCRQQLAHDNSSISCQICHSSWATSCFGCHLPTKANERTALNKFEGMTTRGFATYNPQVVRDDVFMLGLDSTAKGNRLAVLRSSSAVVVSSQNANREWSYLQQQTISAEGYSGQAFNPHFPHTTSAAGTTRNCTDCHPSLQKDNNAIMTQLLGFGTGTVNFFGRYAWVGSGEGGLDGVAWTELEEPQAAIGSHLHRLAYPEQFQRHRSRGAVLEEAHHQPAGGILDLTVRGEYLYAAAGAGGLVVFDVANIANKAFSDRIVRAPVSGLGQRTWVQTRYATSVVLPSTLAIDPARTRLPENEEQPIHPLYGYVYVTDREEGLVVVSVATLLDGDPTNNFLRRDAVFNPEGRLSGATHAVVAGRWLYVTCTRGLVVVDLQDPLKPRIVGECASDPSSRWTLQEPRDVGVQFRYAFVTDREGLKVCDITDPTRPVPLPSGFVALKEARRLYLARTYAYVANGGEGLAIIDIENPERPGLVEMFNAEGQLSDTRAVQLGSVNASQFALVADGGNGLRVLQLVSPENVPEFRGFSPRPRPTLIATFPTRAPALAVSRGLDRDRVVDESGNQTVVFGRRGARPFHVEEMAAFYRHHEGMYPTNTVQRREGGVYGVEDVRKQDGAVVTRAGNPVAAPRDFGEEPVPATLKPSTDRLLRRGR